MSVRVDIDGLDELLRQMRRAPKETQAEVRDAAVEVAEDVARDAAQRARGASRQLAAVAPTFRAKRDRVPVVQAASARRVTSSGAKAHEIFWGAEFGSDRLAQFPRRVKGGRSIYPAIEDNGDAAAEKYLRRIEGVFAR